MLSHQAELQHRRREPLAPLLQSAPISLAKRKRKKTRVLILELGEI